MHSFVNQTYACITNLLLLVLGVISDIKVSSAYYSIGQNIAEQFKQFLSLRNYVPIFSGPNFILIVERILHPFL